MLVGTSLVWMVKFLKKLNENRYFYWSTNPCGSLILCCRVPEKSSENIKRHSSRKGL